MQVRKQQLELDMEQQTDSKSGKEYVKAVHCHPAYLTYTSCEYVSHDEYIMSTTWVHHEYIMWNSRLDEAQAGIKFAGKNINNLRYADDTTLWQKVKN